MKKGNPFQIPLKRYNTQYKQFKKIWGDSEYEILLVRHVSSKKRCLAIKKYLTNQPLLISLLQDIQLYSAFKDIKMIHNFMGYSLNQLENNRKNHFKFCIILLYEFGETTLADFQKKHFLTESKRDDLSFLRNLPVEVLKTYRQLETENKIDLSWLVLDPDFVTFDHYRQSLQQLKLCCFSMQFIKEHKLKYLNFDQHCYSARQLRLVNRDRKDKPQVPSRIEVSDIILQSQRQTQGSGCNLQILNKIGLFLLKTMYSICQDVLPPIPKLQLYCMNEQFDIDFNWNLINQYLDQCKRIKDYRVLVQQVSFMIRECKEEKSFSEYLMDIKQMQREECRSEEEEIKMPDIDGYLNQQRIFRIQNRDQGRDATKYGEGKKEASKIQEIQIALKNKHTQQISYEDGSRYRGEVSNGQREGLGIYTFSQGDIFGGEWKNGSMSGKGFYYFTNNERYEGEILGGVKHGFGTYYYKNDDYYTGLWKNDMKQGQGQFFCSATKQLYKGSFKNNFKQSQGTIYYPNSQRFEGFFSLGTKNGEGSIFDSNNRLFLKAKWKNDSIIGIVQMFMANNDYYMGQMSKNKKNGRGIYKYSCGTIYEGQFVDDLQTGQCKIEYPNSDTYEGQVVDGKFQGFGKYFYKRQEIVYEGTWKDGYQNGRGFYTSKNNIKIETNSSRQDILSYNVLRQGEMQKEFQLY